MQKNTVFILSGPAWAGKTTLWHAIEQSATHIEKVVTTTSRSIREGEINGIHYHFLKKSEFESRIHSNDLIEYAIVHTNYYGSTYSELNRIIENDKSPIYIIEPQGMVHLKPLLEDKWYKVVTIFLLPPSLDELKKRLHERGTETPEQFEIRLATALTELEQQDFYDIKIVNDDIETAKEELIKILKTNYALRK
jgi:guanylate kinase